MAIRSARVGKITHVKIFHLIDKEDTGNKEDPLKQLSKISSTEVRKAMCVDAFSVLQTVQYSRLLDSEQATVPVQYRIGPTIGYE